MIETNTEDYNKYRGRCKDFCEIEIQKDSTLTLVRGYYYCPIWNSEEEHWWTVRSDGSIFDPTRKQFPSAGLGIYTPFDGIIYCAECGKQILEEEARFESRYAFCSYKCHGRFVGVYV